MQNHQNIKYINIGNNVHTIGQNAFSGCSGIDSLYIGSGVETISSNAFQGCSSIERLVIPDNVHNIGQYAFSGCSGIDSLYIGSGVETISSNAFQGCSSIERLVIPDNVHNIGQYAFSGCSGIDSLYIGSGVETISSNAFQGCSSIERLVIPDNVHTIGQYAFKSCSLLRYLYLGKGLLKVSNTSFVNCHALDTIQFAASNCIELEGNQAFLNSHPSSITFGDEVERYPDNMLTTFQYLFDTIPFTPSLRYVGANNFTSNSQLQGDVVFPHTIDTIAEGAFADCDNLLSVTTNARTIGSNAFANCDRLVEVALGDSVRTIGDEAFKDCYRLKNVSWGDGITSIGDKAFMGCTRLLRSELPQSLTTIGSHAFDGCVDLGGKLTFPASITTIGDYAYANNGEVSEIEMLGSTPPTIFAHTFSAVDSMVTVSVPCGAVLSYYTTAHWENFPNIVEAPPYRLTATSNNAVMGTAAVTQQPTCTDHTAHLQATANSGYHFLQWNDGNTANPRQIAMTKDTVFEAIFAVNYSYITVACNDSTMGAVSGTGLYNYNAPVTLSATAYDGYHFLKWSDGNTQNPRYLAATRDSLFTAVFVSNVSSITVANANPEMGNVGGSGVYYYMNQVSLTATANYGYHFTQWNDGSTLNPRTITVSQDSTFTAYFGVNSYSIVATPSNTTMGSVSGGGTYNYLHEMQMTATPAYGYHFVKWHDEITDNPRTITVTRDSMFTAQFAANSYAITAEPSDPTMGSTYGSGTYTYGSTATLMAVETYGYHFTQWSDGTTDNPRSLTVQSALTLTAQFEINTFILTVQSSNPAIGTTSGGGSYSYLTPVNIEALPNAGYHFTQWSDGNTDNPRLISITQNATYTAQFAINSYALAVQSNNSNMGAVSGSGTYNHGSTASLSATANYGYHFVQWSDGNTDNPRSVVVIDSSHYTAEFSTNSYFVNAISSNITLGGTTGSGNYNYLQQVALTAVPLPHYHFTMWNDSIEDNPRTLTVTRDTTLTAHFAIDRHTVTILTADSSRGSVIGSDTVDYGTAVWVTASPLYGYHFTQWNDDRTDNPRRVVVEHDTSITAQFAPNQYTAHCNVNDSNRGEVANAGGTYGYLTPLTFSALPSPLHHFLRWSNGSTTNPITFTLTRDTMLTAIFVSLTTASADSSMGLANHTKQSNLTEQLIASPNYGYHFTHWHDGNTENPRYVKLHSDTLFTAHFAINQYRLTVRPEDSAMGNASGSGHYNYLQQATLYAQPAAHHHFVQWSDGSTTNPRMVVIASDTTFTAIFTEDERRTINVTSNDSTRGSAKIGETGIQTGTYYLGENATLIATANEHSLFAGWSDGVSSNPRVITVVNDATYTALFEPVSHSLLITANDYSMGSVSGTGSYHYGSMASIAAQPFDNCRFVRWSDGDTLSSRQITVDGDMQLEAHFESTVGIAEIEQTPLVVKVSHGRIVVLGADNSEVRIFDVRGRQYSAREKLPAGVYLVCIGHWTARVIVQ